MDEGENSLFPETSSTNYTTIFRQFMEHVTYAQPFHLDVPPNKYVLQAKDPIQTCPSTTNFLEISNNF